MYDGDLGDMTKWWNAWKEFMFVKKLKIKSKEGITESIPYSMLQLIKKSKYPDITEVSEQKLCLDCAGKLCSLTNHRAHLLSFPCF
jgi:hypothetical protein